MKVLNNILFLERLNLLSLLIIVPVYKTLNYKVYFYHYKGKYDFLINYLNLVEVDFQEFNNVDIGVFFHGSSSIANKYYDNFISSNEIELYSEVLKINDTNGKKKIVVNIKDNIKRLIGDSNKLLYCVDLLNKKSQGRIKVFLYKKPLLSYVIKEVSPDCPISILPSLLWSKWFLLIASKIKSSLLIVFKSKYKKEQKNLNNKNQVLYFPHKGVAYSNVFIKDYCYDYRSSLHPLSQKKILHIEYDYKDKKSIDSVIKVYKKNKSRFFIVNDSIGVKTFKLMFNSIKEKKMLFFLRFGKESFNRFIIYLVTTVEFNQYYSQMAPINARMAIIGYDILFPKSLALVLHRKKILTISTQERFPIAFSGNYNVCTDIYLTWGRFVEGRINSDRGFNYVGEFKVVGPPRVDLIKSLGNSEKYNQKTGLYKKIVAVFDGGDGYSVHENRKALINSWSAVKLFLNDVLILAERNTDVFFILRTRDPSWMKDKYFSKVIRKIKEFKNVRYDMDFSELHQQYKILNASDLVIAQHTSIADEALAIGMPVIFHDYSPYSNKIYASNFDYENSRMFCHSRNDFIDKFDTVISNGRLISECEKRYLMEEYYGNSYRKNSKERIMYYLYKYYHAQ
jgi:hypothetical protein